jgi:hypothetical protein
MKSKMCDFYIKYRHQGNKILGGWPFGNVAPICIENWIFNVKIVKCEQALMLYSPVPVTELNSSVRSAQKLSIA